MAKIFEKTGMCYGLSLEKEKKEFEKAYFASIKPGSNILPFKPGSSIYDSNLYCISCENPSQIYPMKMGISPSWGKEHSNSNTRKYRILNINADSAFNWERYAKLVRERRCLILADSFFELTFKTNFLQNSSGFYRFQLNGQKLFAVAGIYDIYDDNHGYAMIITTKFKRNFNHPLFQRKTVPVILDPDYEADWLNPTLTDNEIKSLLNHAFTKEDIEARLENSSTHKPNRIVKLSKDTERIRKI
ncbi:SOS response-associated peptidase [Antarcticibacterium sp. 1MA-6-2]|uniref:SOS response-associated peptidase family protein n=1 Tax=Antarcticibacterium sp. 1MA-6-2 TaxID=2908210 RepID=UPI001F489A47|nr:SOS response-associated peptidase family protein [Antarcticibacterium sp. 1MA-6-2]UJH90404.1 SOS response-associated peptidase [Antarcticibacterium sp. 1MA-6-2]